MPVGYLVFVSFMAVSVLAAVAAPARPPVVGTATAMLATLPNELPLLVAVLVAQSTWGAITDGGLLDSVPGRVVLSGVLALEVALLVLLSRGLRARGAVSDALALTFGSAEPGRGTRGVVRTLLTPLAIKPRDVERTGNVSYGPGGRRHRLDVYRSRRPSPEPAPAPVLLYLHGGAYYFGSKRRRAMLHHLAARGWICISADYRIRPKVSHPDHLVDVKRALAWTRVSRTGFSRGSELTR